MNKIEIIGFETGNNRKVRIALEYKDLDYEFHTIDRHDRARVIELTGQPLTPVMRHGDVILFDSHAIIRYLDANFPEAPRLFTGDRKTLVAIEGWETFSRSKLYGPLVRMVNHRLQHGDDPAVREATAIDFRAALEELTPAIQGREWLVGYTMTAADVVNAPVVARGVEFGLCPREDIDADLLAWVDRVMALDRPAV